MLKKHFFSLTLAAPRFTDYVEIVVKLKLLNFKLLPSQTIYRQGFFFKGPDASEASRRIIKILKKKSS
jgi:hypothetical protein